MSGWSDPFEERYDRIRRDLKELPAAIDYHREQITAHGQALARAERALDAAQDAWLDLLRNDADQMLALEAHRAAVMARLRFDEHGQIIVEQEG